MKPQVANPQRGIALWLSLAIATFSLSVSLFALSVQAAPPLPQHGLVMHLESRIGVQTQGNRVKYWWDQSGNGNDLIGVGTPVIKQSGPSNSQPAIEFNNANDGLRQRRGSGLPTHDNDRTLFVLSAPNGEGSSIGYGKRGCNGFFALEHDASGYSALSTGCKNSLMHATGAQGAGEWHLNTMVLDSGTLYHLRDGELVDGRSRRFNTGAGAFTIRLPERQAAVRAQRNNPNSKAHKVNNSRVALRVAAVLMYDWALSQNEIRQVQRYLGATYFKRANQFRSPPNFNRVSFPRPQMDLAQEVRANGSLELSWRVSFADECRAQGNWSNSRSTSGSKVVRSPVRGSAYGLDCWHSRASASESFNTDLRDLRLSWQLPEGAARPTAYKVFLGTRPGNYTQAMRLPANPSNSHTLQLPPGTYYLAMSTVANQGRESGLSGELRVRLQ